MYAKEDSKKKELIEAKNNADAMIYQSESALDELKEKISDEDKEKIEKAVEDLKAVKDSEDLDEIKNKTEELTKSFYAVSEEIYKQQASQEGGAEGATEEDVVDADYEVVDEDEEEK